MKKLTRILVVAIAAMTLLSSGAVAASAADNGGSSASKCAIKPADEPQDVIITKWRTLDNGVRQYRRWNVTKNCWVDPEWITP